ncbi:hypothetical protein EV201_0628 [Ancylomarina subtilis]|uniref:Uncharacterized protein n=1 Tax=Ancylomarina subtilis TaxID=1639035 RepID=A0A4Q7VIP6_9BACT|nr:DUF6266 family protein [Ancylomarina subtilis]RZT95999.1 hypothetical protein EV201_0628 [Ancylomarina subtilis]
MGKISQGVLGGFSGKVGNIVGGSWKGIDYMRIKPSNVANPRTQGQLDQRTKFAKVLNFLQPMTEFLRVGYKLYAIKMTQFNSAMSYQLQNAITGDYPDYSIDYSKVLVSKGNLLRAVGGAVESTVAGVVKLSWIDNSASGGAKATDKALILLYNADKQIAVYDTAGAVRTVGTQNLSVPTDFSGDEVQAYLGFISEDGTEVANSVYIGAVTVA